MVIPGARQGDPGSVAVRVLALQPWILPHALFCLFPSFAPARVISCAVGCGGLGASSPCFPAAI